MPTQGVTTAAVYMAYNTSSNTYVTGDSANHTIRYVQDGTEATPTNAPAQVDSTNAPGAYKITLTIAETGFGTVWIGGKSSTANVIIQPITLQFSPPIVAITSNIKKNSTSNGFMFVMTNSTTNVPQPGLGSVVGTVAQDGAPFVALTNSVSEVSNGVYTINFAAADTNCNHMLLRFTAATANDRLIEIITQP